MNVELERMRNIAVIALLFLGLLLPGGCNTVEGVGEDIAAGGQTVADWAAGTNPETK